MVGLERSQTLTDQMSLRDNIQDLGGALMEGEGEETDLRLPDLAGSQTVLN
jgi:hypothetical protein